ncbi:putative FMN/FAD exporter YeeO [bacterium HR17]|uniref:Multidrug-efflux transporter n=1 Tax=Candidatus Fervidibacter japonicus TaxID=2035412 RepID=A0A2H5XF65_9BACT|nr:putative FMN/FAD exporter YeeO [bacterium HR17]
MRKEPSATEGSLLTALVTLTMPSLLTQIGQTVGWLGEAYFVGQLGTTATAAIGAVGQVGWVLMGMTIMVSTGTTTLVAQRWGARDAHGAVRVEIAALQQSLLFSLLAVSVWFLRQPLWALLNIPPAMQRLADAYFAVALLSFPLMSVAVSLMAAYRGIGDMVTPLWATLVGVAVQLSLCAWCVPRWGISGAAFALAVSRGAVLAVLLGRLAQSPLRFSWAHCRTWCSRRHRDLLKLGLPAGLQSLLWSMASTVYFRLLASTPEKESAIAALTAGLRIEAIAFMPGIAFATVAQALVGQCVGAKQWQRATAGAWQAALACAVTMSLMATFFFVMAEPLAVRFAKDALTQHYIAAYLRINALSEPFLGIGMTLGGALRGLGDTATPALLNIVTLWLLRLPTTYWLCGVLGLDTVAAWWTMSVTTVVNGTLTAIAFAVRLRRAPAVS